LLTADVEQNPAELKILALFIIDIVEGSAVDALPAMKPLIRSRPSGFESIDKAIEWT
jgi:protein phosphatase methylesterase 1